MRRLPKPHVLSRRKCSAKLKLEPLECRTQPAVQIASLATFQVGTASGILDRTSVSDDGRYAVFASTADNVAPNDSDGQLDVFLYDRTANSTTLISRNKSGQAVGAIGPDNTTGSVPAISGDGRYAIFASQADAGTIVTGSTVTDAGFSTTDLFRYDRVTGAIALVSRNASGNAAGGDADASISTDGNVVAFASSGDNLVAGLAGTQAAIYAYNFATGAMVLVSHTSAGGIGNQNSYNPLLSRDGSSVLYTTMASNLLPPGTDANALDDLYLTKIADGSTALVSRDATGRAAGVPNQFTYEQSGISDDGNHVAFIADTNLVAAPVPNDPRDKYYTFLYDRTVDAVSLVSRNTSGNAVGNSGYYQNVAGISGDGKSVLFDSDASDVVPNDTNGGRDVFVLDRTTNSIVLVSRNAAGNPLDDTSFNPTMSRDGKFVEFLTVASDYPGGTRFRAQAAVFDRTAGTVTLASRNAAGNGGNNPVTAAVISGDGSVVAFQSTANDLVAGDAGQSADLFAFDRVAQTVSLVSARTGPSSATANASSTIFNGTLAAHQLGTSTDGQYAVFISDAGNLVPNDRNSAPDIFLYDRLAATVTLVSRDLSGNAAGVDSFIVGQAAAISRDGNWVTFSSGNDNIVPNDGNFTGDVFLFNRITGAISLVSHRNGQIVPAEAFRSSNNATISDDGRYVAFVSTANLTGQNPTFVAAAYLYDRVTDSTVLASRTLAGTAADVRDKNDYYAAATVSGDGSTVAFQTTDPNVVAGDTNAKSDVFRFDRLSGTVTLVSRTAAGSVGNDGSYFPQVNRDGTIITFHSLASNLATIDANGREDLFVYNAATQTVALVSRDGTGAAAAGVSGSDGVVSADGKYVAFTTDAPLVAGDTNGTLDVYLYDRAANTNALVSHTATGTASVSFSLSPTISDDGSIVAFRSAGPDLAPGAVRFINNVFFFDRASGFVGLVSADASGMEGNNPSDTPAVTGDGKVIAFNTDATSFIANDRNGATDVAVVALTAPSVAVGPVSPSPRNVPIGSIPITFDFPVSGFDKADLSLIRVDTSGSTPISLSGAGVTLTTADNKVFTLSGLAGLTSVDGTYTLTLTAAGSGIVNTQSNLPLTTNAAASFVVDATPPRVVSINPTATRTNAATTVFAVQFSEPVTGVSPADFNLIAIGLTGTSVTGASVVGGNGSLWAVTVATGSGVGTLELDLIDADTIRDAAANPLGGAGVGNGNFAAGSKLAVDRVSPTVLSVTRIGNSPTNSTAVQFRVTFSEPVQNVALNDFIPNGITGAAAASAAPSSDRRSVVVTATTGGTDGTLGLSVRTGGGISDDFGNLFAVAFAGGETYTIDTTAPTVSVQAGVGQANPATTSPIVFSVNFSDSVSGFSSANVAVSGSAGATTATVTGSGTAFTVTVTGMLQAGTVQLTVAAGVSSDAAGNLSAAASATLVYAPASVVPPLTPVPPDVPITPVPPPVAAIPPPVGSEPIPKEVLHLSTRGGTPGTAPVLQVLNPDGSTRFTLDIFEASFTSGISVVLADVNDDGIDDIIAGAGDAGGPRVRVFDGKTGTVLADFFAFDSSARTGVMIAVQNSDGVARVVATAGQGGDSRVRTFRGVDGQLLSEFLAYEDRFRGGVNLSIGDVTGDGVDDVVTGTRSGGAPRVRVFNGKTGAIDADFYAGDPNARDGVQVAVRKLVAGGRPELATKTSTGGIRVFDPLTREDISDSFDPRVLSGVFVGG